MGFMKHYLIFLTFQVEIKQTSTFSDTLIYLINYLTPPESQPLSPPPSFSKMPQTDSKNESISVAAAKLTRFGTKELVLRGLASGSASAGDVGASRRLDHDCRRGEAAETPTAAREAYPFDSHTRNLKSPRFGLGRDRQSCNLYVHIERRF